MGTKGRSKIANADRFHNDEGADEAEEEEEEGAGEVTAGNPIETLASAAASPSLLPDLDQHRCANMTTAASSATIHRKPSSVRRGTPAVKRSAVNGTSTKPSSPGHPSSNGGERTVKKLRLSKALTIPEGTMVSEACRRMAHRRMDAVLLTDSNGMLSGIVTDKDIAVRVVAEALRPDQTLTSKIMTRNPVFVSSDSLAIDALQTMVQGKFRHLPVVENGEVVALLDITKCLYDAISRMEKAAEQGSAIAAAVEGVERHLGGDFSAHYNIIETLRERMFKPSLSTIITENTKVAVVSPTDTVYLAMKKMREHRLNSVVIVTGGKPQGILTSKDVLMRVVAHNLSPELTFVEKVMTSNPERATLDTTILDALHIMHDGKFLHLPVVDQDGCTVACVDVLQIAHATISMVIPARGAGTANDPSTMMQKFWDSTLALEPPDDECETQSELSALMTSDCAETSKPFYPSLGLGQFSFKFEDQKGHKHRLNCGSESLNELLTAVMERIGSVYKRDGVRLLYEDDEGDKVLLVSDSDLVAAVNDARSAGLKVLKLHIDGLDLKKVNSELSSSRTVCGWTTLHTAVISGAIILAGISIMVYSKRSSCGFHR